MITYVFLLNEAIANVPTYLLSSSAFLSIKLADFYIPKANLIALLTLVAHIHFAKFSAKILDWRRYFIQIYCALASKKKKLIPDWYLHITQMETKWTKWYAMTSHTIAYRSTELLFGTHTFNFNCFFYDFNCVYTQIRCLSRLLCHNTSTHEKPVIFTVVKPVLSDHSKRRPKLFLRPIIAQCWSVIKLPLTIKIFALSIFEWPL